MGEKTSPSYKAAHGGRLREKGLEVRICNLLLDGPAKRTFMVNQLRVMLWEINAALDKLKAAGLVVEKQSRHGCPSIFENAVTPTNNPLGRPK